MQIYSVKKDDLGPSWLDVIGERELAEAVWADFGFPDAQIAFISCIQS